MYFVAYRLNSLLPISNGFSSFVINGMLNYCLFSKFTNSSKTNYRKSSVDDKSVDKTQAKYHNIQIHYCATINIRLCIDSTYQFLINIRFIWLSIFQKRMFLISEINWMQLNFCQPKYF